MIRFALNLSLFGLFIVCLVNCSNDWSSDIQPQKWNKYAKEKIDYILKRQLNGNVAKNVILFLGDGMFRLEFVVLIKKNYLIVRYGNINCDCWSNKKRPIEK